MPSGNAFQFCSRHLPDPITRCDIISSPELNSDTPVVMQGKAVVSSTDGPECSRIAVEARVYYTTGEDDTAISAISNSKIVFIDEGNLGD